MKGLSIVNQNHGDMRNFESRYKGNLSMEPNIMGLSKKKFYWEAEDEHNRGKRDNGGLMQSGILGDSATKRKKKPKGKKLGPVMQPRLSPYNVVKLIKSLDFREVSYKKKLAKPKNKKIKNIFRMKNTISQP